MSANVSKDKKGGQWSYVDNGYFSLGTMTHKHHIHIHRENGKIFFINFPTTIILINVFIPVAVDVVVIAPFPPEVGSFSIQ